MWLVYSDPVDASVAAAFVSRRYLRLQSQRAADGKLVTAGALVDGAAVPDEDLGPFAYTLPGRRAGVLVTDGTTERWALPVETASGDWAFPLPDGWAAADVTDLPNGYVETESVELAGGEV